MNNRSGVVGVGFFGLLLTVLLTRAEPSPAPPGEQPTETLSQSRDSTRRGGGPLPATYNRGAQLIREYLGDDSLLVPVRLPVARLGILIATLPDPYDSHLDQSYDTYLEALRRAFENSGYVLDRFWLPGRNDSTRWGRDSTRFASREVHPGVILFRRVDGSGAPAALHLLYLVGEIPTGGIHKIALRNALAERTRLIAPGEADTIRIVGPVFSGSTSSLRLAIDANVPKGVQVSVVSGSATNPANATLLTSANITYAATVHDDEVMLQVLREAVLKRMGSRRIALLRESTTGYGQSLARTIVETGNAHEHADTLILNVPFPLNIGSLRAEYEAHPVTPAPKSTLPVARQDERLPLALKDAARPRETPPVTSVLTAPTLDLVLDELMRLLRTREIEAVGILATDVRDKLFLGELIHRRLPDVQLFTFESNSLYRRKDFGPALHGMVVVSTYPLIAENQRWVAGARRGDAEEVVAFSSDGAQGIYNAAAMQLGSSQLLEYGAPLGPADYGGPPVWITAVGAGSFVPLAACDPYGGSPAPNAATASSDSAAMDSARARGASVAVLDSIAVARVKRARADTLRKLVVRCNAFRIEGQANNEPLDLHSVGFLAWAAAFGVAVVMLLALIDYHRWIRKTGPPRGEVIGRVVDRRPTERGTILVQAELYAGLRLIALMGMYLPVAAVIGLGSDLLHAHTGRTWLGKLALLGMVIGIVLFIAWWMYLAIAVKRATGFARKYLQVTRHYILGRNPNIPKGEAVTVRAWLHELLHSRTRKETFSERRARLDFYGRMSWAVEIIGRFAIVGFGIVYLVLTLMYVRQVWLLGGENDMRFVQHFHRALRVESGLSPLLPLVIAAAGFACWSSWHIKRIRLLLDTTVFEAAVRSQPDLDLDDPLTGALRISRGTLKAGMHGLTNRLILLVPGTRGAVLFVALTVSLGWLIIQFESTLEAVAMARTAWANVFDLLFYMSVIASLSATTWAVYRLLSIWRGLSACLNAIADTPLLTSFERLPRRLSSFGRPSLLRGPSRDAVLVTAEMQWKHLRRIYLEKRVEIENDISTDKTLRNGGVCTRMHDLMCGCEVWKRRPATGTPTEDMGQRLGQLYDILDDLWEAEPSGEEIDQEIGALAAAPSPSDQDAPRRNTSDEFRRRFTGAVGIWMRVAEEFVAVQAANYIEWVQGHLRILALFILLSLLLTTGLLSSYPFQPESLVRILFVGILASAVGAVLFVMTAMNRNEVLSKIGNTTPGEIAFNGTFIINLALYVVLPLLTLLSSEFPRLRSVVFAWAEPLIRSITKL